MTYESIYDDLVKLCPSDWQQHISMEILAGGSCAYRICGQALFYVRFSPKTRRVEIDPSFVDDPDRITPNHKMASTGILTLSIDMAFNHEHFLDVVKVMVEDKIKAYNFDRFGCCNLFMECSDNLKCFREGDLEYMGCYYRENLMQGRIFYGKNAPNVLPDRHLTLCESDS